MNSSPATIWPSASVTDSTKPSSPRSVDVDDLAFDPAHAAAPRHNVRRNRA